MIPCCLAGAAAGVTHRSPGQCSLAMWAFHEKAIAVRLHPAQVDRPHPDRLVALASRRCPVSIRMRELN